MIDLKIEQIEKEIKLENEKIKLRKFKLSDWKDWIEFLNENILKYREKNEVIEYMNVINEKWKNKEEFTFAIYLNSSNKLVGFISLFNIDWKNNYGFLGYWISKSYRNRNIATQATKIFLDFCGCYLKLKEIYAKVLETNYASIKVLEKNGFEKLKIFERINGSKRLYYKKVL